MTLPALRLIWLSLSLVLALSAGIAAADRLSLPLPWWGAFFLLALLGMGLGARYGRKAFFFFLIPVFFASVPAGFNWLPTATTLCPIRPPELISSP